VLATIPIEQGAPRGVAVTPDGSKIYVANTTDPPTVSVIDTATDMVIATVPVAPYPYGVAVTPDSSKVYVTNTVFFPPNTVSTVSVIDTATNMVVAVVPVGNHPFAFGVFIQPRFAGTPGNGNCPGKSVSALAQTFGGLNAAAIALGLMRFAEHRCRRPAGIK
jgi:YVTN family beta-propeller protein